MNGKIHLVTGPMFSGKSAWLIKKLYEHYNADNPLLAIRYTKDNRYSTDSIASHNGTEFEAKSAKNIEEVKKIIADSPPFNIFAIDEIQFFEKELAEILQELKKKNILVYAGGLDTDFLANPWNTTEAVRKIADDEVKLLATCSVCQVQNATRTQRLISGKPASRKSPRILIADTDSYTARCELHHEIVD